MDDIEKLIVLFLVLVLAWVTFNLGQVVREDRMLDAYCEHQQGIYERIDDIDYCIVDRQLQEIEWVK